MITPQSQVALVEQDVGFREVAKQLVDAFAADGSRLVHALRAQVAGPQGATVLVGDDGCFPRVLFLLARHECPPPAAAGRGPADLDLGGVQAQLDVLGLSVGELFRHRS